MPAPVNAASADMTDASMTVIFCPISAIDLTMRSGLHMQIHQLGRRHHVVVQVGHDAQRPGDDDGHDEHAKRQRQHVVGVVRSGGDVQEKDQVAENGEISDEFCWATGREIPFLGVLPLRSDHCW